MSRSRHLAFESEAIYARECRSNEPIPLKEGGKRRSRDVQSALWLRGEKREEKGGCSERKASPDQSDYGVG